MAYNIVVGPMGNIIMAQDSPNTPEAQHVASTLYYFADDGHTFCVLQEITHFSAPCTPGMLRQVRTTYFHPGAVAAGTIEEMLDDDDRPLSAEACALKPLSATVIPPDVRSYLQARRIELPV
jgi:hypothetical protein